MIVINANTVTSLSDHHSVVIVLLVPVIYYVSSPAIRRTHLYGDKLHSYGVTVKTGGGAQPS